MQAGLEDGPFGFAMFCGALGALFAMWVAPILDRRFRGWALIVSGTAMALSFFLPAIATSWWLMALAMIMTMGSTGLLDVIMNTRLSMVEAQTGRKLMNLNHALYSFSYGLTAVFAGLLRSAGWSALHSFAVFILIALCLCFGLRDRALDSPQDCNQSRTKQRLPWAMIILSGGIAMIAFTAEQATDNWSALHLERAFNVMAHQSALGPAILGLTMGLGRLFGQVLLGSVSAARVVQVAAVTAAVGMALGGWAPSIGLSYLGFGMFGLGISVVGPLVISWAGSMIQDDQRSIVISRVLALTYIGFFIGPPVLGVLAQLFGLPVAFSMMALLVLISGLVLVPLLQRVEMVSLANRPRNDAE